MNAFATFPALRWNAQQLTDAVPLRLHALYAFDAAQDDVRHRAANHERPSGRVGTRYLATLPLPARFHVR